MRLKYPSLRVLLLLLVYGCTNPIEDIKIVIDANVIKHSALITVTDPQQPGKTPANISLSVGGRDSAFVYEISGKREFKVTDGMIALGIAPGKTINKDSPAECLITVSAPGYLPSSQTLSFSAEQSQQLITVNLIKAISPPPGVSIAQKSAALTEGQLSQAFKTETPLQNKNESATVTFSRSTAFNNEDKTIKGKLLLLSLSHFDSHSPASLQLFPGGLLSKGVTLPDGSTGTINFSTAGFFRLSLTVDNTPVSSADRDMAFALSIDPGLTNPGTGKTVTAGDKIGVWYYDEKSGKWAFLQQALIENAGNSKLSARFSSNAAGYYALCWYTVSCTSTLQVNVHTKNTNAGNGFIAAFFNSTDFFPYYVYRLDLSASSSSFSYKNLPQGLTKVAIFDYSAFNTWQSSGAGTSAPTPLTESGWIEACTSAPLDLSIPAGGPASEITLEFTGYCPLNQNLAIRPSMYVSFRESGTSSYQYLGYMNKGTLTTKALTPGKSYDFKSSYNGETIKVSRRIEQSTVSEKVQLPESTCKSF